MSRIITLSISLLMAIGSTDVVLSQTAQQNSLEAANQLTASMEAGIRVQALKIYPWMSQSQQRELWIADRMSEQLDRQAGNSYTVRVKR